MNGAIDFFTNVKKIQSSIIAALDCSDSAREDELYEKAFDIIDDACQTRLLSRDLRLDYTYTDVYRVIDKLETFAKNVNRFKNREMYQSTKSNMTKLYIKFLRYVDLINITFRESNILIGENNIKTK